MLLSKLKCLEVIRALATNIGVIPETDSECRLMLHGCPLISPPLIDYGELIDDENFTMRATTRDQDVAKLPEDPLTAKDNPYFKG